MPGPQPEPPEVSLQKGTSHSAVERAKKAVKAPRSRPELPQRGGGDLETRTAEIFEETVGRLVELGVDYAGDRGIVEAYSGELAMLEHCDYLISLPDFESIVVNGRGSMMANPLIALRRNSAAAVHKFGQALGLTPSSRANLPARTAEEGPNDGVIF